MKPLLYFLSGITILGIFVFLLEVWDIISLSEEVTGKVFFSYFIILFLSATFSVSFRLTKEESRGKEIVGYVFGMTSFLLGIFLFLELFISTQLFGDLWGKLFLSYFLEIFVLGIILLVINHKIEEKSLINESGKSMVG